jgi:hypothetical protein
MARAKMTLAAAVQQEGVGLGIGKADENAMSYKGQAGAATFRLRPATCGRMRTYFA